MKMTATEKRNAAFEALSPAEKRVQIAKDVLSALRKKKIKPMRGSFLGASFKKKVPRDTQVDTILRNKTCRVCAIGAMFTCAIDRANNLKADRLYINEYISAHIPLVSPKITQFDVWPYLERFFDKHNLCEIEAAFEFGKGYAQPQYDDMDSERYALAAKKYAHIKDHAARMRAIMRNIIEHDGEFVL